MKPDATNKDYLHIQYVGLVNGTMGVLTSR